MFLTRSASSEQAWNPFFLLPCCFACQLAAQGIATALGHCKRRHQALHLYLAPPTPANVYRERPDLACSARPSPDGSRMLRLQIVDGTGRDRMGVRLFSELVSDRPGKTS